MNIIDVGLSFGEMNMNNHPSMLIVHHLEAEGINWTVEQIHNMHKNENGWAGIGYHYYIRLDGSVYKGRPDEAIGAHCQGCNTNTLGVSFEGDYGNRIQMPDAQFAAWCELKEYLCNMYGNMPVFGHREKGSSECPGAHFPLEMVREANFAPSLKLGWNQNKTGWWYCTDTANGYYYKNAWKQINGEWYYFDNDGYAMCNAWIKWQDKWYRLRDNCMMAKKQWLWVEGECYCFDDTGAMYENCTTPDGYRVDETGAWIK
ncbi:N-acetylmuramoyl-L-alanine amidase [Clostridium sp. YIM B02555]|uniref:N-acetylmuramoyl-L-alanine amidase n=1 Tax=Clostridium sp. YIM B02555 TaxID=2911968 RepID=UPI001EED6A0C|nr:N-acetylmuramoyl-L-alanine amidase [Clostridium sp. YIM B02555]